MRLGSAGMRDSLGVLRRSRDFRLFFAGQLTSNFGTSFATLALPFAVLAMGGGAGEIGIVMACRTGSMLVFLAIGGAVADRLERRRVLLGSDAVMLASQAVIAVSLLTGHATTSTLAVSSLFGGAAAAFFRPATSGFRSELVSPADLGPANALSSIANDAAGLLGPVVAGILVAITNAGWAYAIDAATYAVSIAAFLAMRIRPLRRREPSAGIWAEIRTGASYTRGVPWLVVLLAENMAYQLIVLPPLFVLGPLLAERNFGGAAAWGIALAAFAGGSLLGNVALLHHRPRRGIAVGTSVMPLIALALVVIGVSHSGWLVWLAMIPGGFSISYCDTLAETVMQTNVAPSMLGRVVSWDWLASSALRPVGLVVVGPIAAAVGWQRTMIAASILIVVVAVLALIPRAVWRVETATTGDPPSIPSA